MFHRVVILLYLTSFFSSSYAQESSELSYAEQLLALEQELDSLSIFNFLDSALLLEQSIKSEFNLHLGFTSSVTSAGRDFDINQSGLSSGVSYFDKSGVYADVSGYWNSDVNPNYNPTIFSVGYLGNFRSNWSYSFDYEHWFNNPQDTSSNLLTNSLSTSLGYNIKTFSFSLDYSYLFGEVSSHRIIGDVSATINLGKWWHFNNISIIPYAAIMIGNGEITTLRITRQQLSEERMDRIERIQSLSDLDTEQRNYLLFLVGSAFRNGQITEQQRNSLRNDILTADRLSDDQLDELNDLVMNGVSNRSFIDETSFGVLNYSFSLPLSLATGRCNLMLSYTYSIPVKLPMEFFDVDPIGYFSASLSYRIPFK